MKLLQTAALIGIVLTGTGLSQTTSTTPLPSNGTGGVTGLQANASITVGKLTRYYRLLVPTTIKPEEPAPLVFAFHGLYDSKEHMAAYTQLDKTANANNFMIVYLDAINNSWPIIKSLTDSDFAFFDSLYALLISKYNVDLNRVYFVGMSNGAIYANLLAANRADKVAAVASASGSLYELKKTGLNVAHKYGVIAIHGNVDGVISVTEGRDTRDYYTKWGHNVTYYEVAKMGHMWATQISVNDKIWSYFKAHPF